jgi:BirA family transcriptional regulator, biotin operon repressor / biotin---[acetyl-CoA-carboxylase] ligase
MKTKILQLLRQHSEVISGETLSSELGTSRVSIWKHIRGLQALGYEIEATAKGYRLVRAPDTPFAWEFPQRQERIHFFESVGSTMDVARDLARKGCPRMTVVVAGAQKKGRGRMTRTWRSGRGGLYFTVVVRLPVSPLHIGRVNFYAATVLAQTLREAYGVQADVKWPNDILVAGKKLCGMLSEMEAEGEQVTFVNIGMGINVNNDPVRQEPNATTLKRVLKQTVSRKELLGAFLDRFEQDLDTATSADVIERWKTYTATIGRPVQVVTHNDTIEGRAVDVDPSGALLVEQADGTIKTVVYGDCFHRPLED